MSERGKPILRRAEVRDVDALVTLRFRLLQEAHFVPDGTNRIGMEDAFRAYFRTYIPSGDFTGWVAEVDGEVVATGGMVLWHKPPLDDDPSGREAYIMNMYTIPDLRGNGIAAKIVDKLIEDARIAGIKRIRLHASESGAKIYKAKGFVFNPSDMILDLTL
jgi:GNAT superfamily N-acetyltransferase